MPTSVAPFSTALFARSAAASQNVSAKPWASPRPNTATFRPVQSAASSSGSPVAAQSSCGSPQPQVEVPRITSSASKASAPADATLRAVVPKSAAMRWATASVMPVVLP